MWRAGALVFYEDTQQRWIDAMGSNAVKVLYDFARLPVDDTTGDPIEWTCTMVEAGSGDSTVTLGTEEGGVMIISSAANEDDGVNMQLKGEAFKLESGKPCYFGIRMKLSEATQSDVLVGLCITDTTLLGGMTDGVYFEKLDGGTTINFVSEKNSTETTTALSTAMDTSYHIFEFLWDGTTLSCYLDGTETAHTQTNIPDDEPLTPSIHFLAGSAGVKTCTVDWLRAIQLR